MRSTCNIAAVLVAACLCHAELPAEITDPKDRAIVEAYLGYVKESPATVTKLAKTKLPEDHCWKTGPVLDIVVPAYRLTRDTQYLDLFVKNFGILHEQIAKGPDGYLGWYGKALKRFHPKKRPDLKVDVIITSFRIVESLCEFIRLIDQDPALRKRYAAERKQYVELMTRHLVPKWDARKCYMDLGKRGAVYRTHPDLVPWKGSLTQPANKNATIGRALLELYEVTGDDEYVKKAIKLGTFFKRCLKLKKDRYNWNYWEPAGKWDIHPDKKTQWKHWLGAEHKASYYNLSLNYAIRLFREGLVYDRTDIDRFVKTQLEVTWNGDFKNPKWATTAGKPRKSSYMCGGLAPYSQTIAEYCKSRGGGDREQRYKKHNVNSWQGGVLARGYIDKLARQIHGARKKKHIPIAERFLKKPANQAFVDELAFTVEPPGYWAPIARRAIWEGEILVGGTKPKKKK